MLNRLRTYLDRLTRRGRHSHDYIHLFYIPASQYVGARA